MRFQPRWREAVLTKERPHRDTVLAIVPPKEGRNSSSGKSRKHFSNLQFKAKLFYRMRWRTQKWCVPAVTPDPSQVTGFPGNPGRGARATSARQENISGSGTTPCSSRSNIGTLIFRGSTLGAERSLLGCSSNFSFFLFFFGVREGVFLCLWHKNSLLEAKCFGKLRAGVSALDPPEPF